MPVQLKGIGCFFLRRTCSLTFPFSAEKVGDIVTFMAFTKKKSASEFPPGEVRGFFIFAYMPDAKRTKRLRDASEELGLEEHIAVKRDALVAARHQAPKLRAQAKALQDCAKDMNRRWQTRMSGDLRARASELEREACVRESMTREHAFESTVVSYLRQHHRDDSGAELHNGSDRSHESRTKAAEAYVRRADRVEQRRAAILDEYLVEMNQAPPKVAMAARDECPRCAIKFVLCSVKSIMTCPTCGYSVAYLDHTSSTTAYDECIDFSPYSYRRVNHWVMWLSLVQGKEAHQVPDDILEQTMHELCYTQGVRNPADITQTCVRNALRRLRLRKAYDHVAQVTARLSGTRPLRIPKSTEELLRNMFLQMQPAFTRHAPKTRSNFLSYPYVLYRCFQILGLHDMLPGIALLRGRDKLVANDAIFRKMSIDLGWPVFELPPESATACE